MEVGFYVTGLAQTGISNRFVVTSIYRLEFTENSSLGA